MAFHKSFFVTGYSNQVIMPKDKTDSITISVQESIESMVVTRFSAFESKLNSLGCLTHYIRDLVKVVESLSHINKFEEQIVNQRVEEAVGST